VRFWRVTELVTQLLAAREERALLRLKAQLARLDLLVLDESGYVPTGKVGAELLLDVISTAYERTSGVVTTNLPFEQWTEVLGSERLVGATPDRVTHRCHVLEATDESYRLRDAKRRQAAGPGARGRRREPAAPSEDLRTVSRASRRCRPGRINWHGAPHFSAGRRWTSRSAFTVVHRRRSQVLGRDPVEVERSQSPIDLEHRVGIVRLRDRLTAGTDV
jgi:hypothetical protein